MTAPHNLANDLAFADFPTSGRMGKTPEGYVLGWGTTVGNGVENWAPNARFIHTDGTVGIRNYRNTGTSTTATWTRVEHMLDDEAIRIGTGSDVWVKWDGTHLHAGPAGKMWGNCPSRLSADYESVCHEYYNDFLVNADYDATNEWTATEDDAACTQALSADAVNGTLLLTCKATTDDNGHQVQLNQESFKLAAGKKLWFETRIKAAAGATQIDWYVGLIEAEDLTGVADNMPANGVVIHKDDGDTNIDASSSDNAVNLQSAAFGTATTGWHRVGFYFDGAATGSAAITPYMDGVAKTSITSVTYATVAEMSPIFGVRNGDGTTQQTLEIDYVKVVQLR